MKRQPLPCMTEAQARAWLIQHDPEAADFWKVQPEGELRRAMFDNLRDYGPERD